MGERKRGREEGRDGGIKSVGQGWGKRLDVCGEACLCGQVWEEGWGKRLDVVERRACVDNKTRLGSAGIRGGRGSVKF